MTRLILLAPLALAACGTPCPVPRECITPEWCVCLVTGTLDPLPDGDGSAAYLAAMPEPTTPPDQGAQTPDSNGWQTADKTTDDSNGHGSSDGSNSSDENGGKSDG